jgi:CRP/FNR family cyclic AMP-dependent transcriptional regulator
LFLTADELINGNKEKTLHGADDYIAKSFTDNHILEVISASLQKSEQMKQVGPSNIQELRSIVGPSKGTNKLKELFSCAEVMEFGKDQTVYREGGHADFVYLIEEGSVQCSKSDYYGKSFVHEVYGAGYFLGYKAMIKNGTYNETVQTLSDTKLSVLPKKDFMDLIGENIEVANFFIETLSTDVIEREQLLLQLAYAPLRERLASVLLKLDERSPQGEGEHVFDISRQDLANMVGAAKESLIRSLSQLKKEGLLDSAGQLITLLNIEGLKRVASGLLA